LEGDRLTDEVERARLQAVLGLALGRPAGNHHGRDAQLANHLKLQEIEAAHSGQGDVEQHRFRAPGTERVERRFSGMDGDRLMTHLAQELGEDHTQGPIVFDHQHAHEGSPLFLSCTEQRAV